MRDDYSILTLSTSGQRHYLALAKDQALTFVGSEVFNSTDATGQIRFDAKTDTLYGNVDAAELSRLHPRPILI